MKNILLILTAVVSYNCALAQKHVPKISAGTEMGYVISISDEKIPFQLNVTSIGDSVKMAWEVSEYGSGTYVMTSKSLENGKKMILQAPQPGEVTELSDSETMAFVSKSAFKSMVKTNTMQFDDVEYNLSKEVAATLKIDNEELDVLHVVSKDGKSEIWILNNPDFPLICKTINGSLGAEMSLKYIH
jgi:hypothetical protein